MIGIYKGKRYVADYTFGKAVVTIYSYEKEMGFENAISPWGKVYDDYFSKQVIATELDYLYELSYELKYRGLWFYLTSSLNTNTISKELFVIGLDYFGSEAIELAEELGFERPDKFYFTKKIYRKDIEALKVIESPQGIFSSQGKNETILEGQAIDDYFASITD